jgi:hypothetical protein
VVAGEFISIRCHFATIDYFYPPSSYLTQHLVPWPKSNADSFREQNNQHDRKSPASCGFSWLAKVRFWPFADTRDAKNRIEKRLLPA